MMTRPSTTTRLWLRRSAALVAAAALTLSAGLAGARPIVPAEKRYSSYPGDVPLCDNQGVLDKITERFSDTESEYWKSGLQIVAFDKVAEIGNRSTGLDFIPRRYCIARATMNTGAISTVSYAIGEDLGWLGAWGWGVEWCVEGLDRLYASAPGCKQKRP